MKHDMKPIAVDDRYISNIEVLMFEIVMVYMKLDVQDSCSTFRLIVRNWLGISKSFSSQGLSPIFLVPRLPRVPQ